VKSVIFGGDIGQVRTVRANKRRKNAAASSKLYPLRIAKKYGVSVKDLEIFPLKTIERADQDTEDWREDNGYPATTSPLVRGYFSSRFASERRKNSGGKVEIELYNASRLNRGGYTKSGTYYGVVRGTKVYEYAIEYASGGRPKYSAVRAPDKKSAKAQLLRMFPGAIIST